MADQEMNPGWTRGESRWGVGANLGDGVPLEVVETRGENVTVEDPEGITFTIPRSWLHAEFNPEKQFSFSHNAIVNAPPGQLEKIWKDETVKKFTDPNWWAGVDDENGVPMKMPEKQDLRSTLEIYNDEQGGFGADPVWSNTNPAEASQRPVQNAWAPKYREPKLRNVNLDIPPDDHRFGEWDEEWDPKTKKWVKRKDL